jgi:arsenate reductase
MEIWVNPACSKCRAATAHLDEAGIDYTVRRYLDEPPTGSHACWTIGLELAHHPHRGGRRRPRARGPAAGPSTGTAGWRCWRAPGPRAAAVPADDSTTVVGRD